MKDEAMAMRVTTEDLYGTRTDASPQQRSDLRHDVAVPKRAQCGVAKGAQGVILDIAALDSFRVAFGGQVITVGAELLWAPRETPADPFQEG